MRPYLAIIKDSFREALASRVLWILLLLITFLLAALAPLGFRAEQITEFRLDDFRDARAFARALMQQYASEEPSPGTRIANSLNEGTRDLLTQFGEESSSSSFFKELGRITDALNDLLAKRDLYQPQDWEGVLLGSEARELLDQNRDTLPENDLARLNRLLIEVPFEEHFRPRPPKQIAITYLGGAAFPPIRVSERRVKQIIELGVIPFALEFLLGPLGLLTAILVTASIIPQMFDPGALSLLLSKPASRSLMFLAKFVGGCAFILINAGYFFIGLWLLLGLRLGIWNHGFLLCIVIFLFLFAVYYSVSALAGVIWRNAIVCIVLTILFWGVCFGAGATKNLFETFLVETQKIVRLVQADDTLLAIDERGEARRWNADAGEWEQVFLEGSLGDMQRVLGPVYDTENRTLMAAQHGHRLFESSSSLLLGRENDGWMQIEGPALPDSTFELLPDPRGRLLTVTYSGVYELAGDVESKKKVKVFFMEIPQSINKPFRPIGPDSELNLAAPAVAAVDHQTANLAIYSRGKLLLLTRDDHGYRLVKEIDVDGDEEQGAAIAITRSTLLLALGDGRVLNYRVPDLQLRAEVTPEPYSQPRFACASPDGNWFAVVFHNARLHLLNVEHAEEPVMQVADVRGQGTISAALFTSDNTLLTADRAKRITEYELGSFARKQDFAPQMTAMEIVYYYVVEPIYMVFPKPSELDNTIQYVLKKEETLELGSPGDLQAMRQRVRPWSPVVSSLIFMIVMLFIACVYIERQEF